MTGLTGPEGSESENVRRERSRAVAMFRYGLIRDAADPGLSSKQRGRLVRALAEKDHRHPSGQMVRYSRDHLDRWIRRWRRGGFDALIPAERQPHARTDPAVLELAIALKRERPGRTVAQITRILQAQSGWTPSETTLLRHFRRAGVSIPGGAVDPGESSTVFGRFEADRPNELWTGDALHGPRIGGHKTYLFAFIDDHTRMIVGHRWGFAEDTVRLAAALRPALAARGVPASVYVDNGSAFVDAWLLRACAKLGIRLTHSTPGRPQGRGKIERFFRTVNDQFLVEIGNTADQLTPPEGQDGDDAAAAGLLELNRLFGAWVEQVYHRAWHSETGQSPLRRWETGWQAAAEHGHPGQPALPRPAELGEAFLWETTRTVRKNATVSLHSNTYQVEDILAGRRVELVFDPFDLTRIEVRYQGRPMGLAIPFRIARHSHPRARPETQPATPATATGINYLSLVVTAHEEALATGVNYAAMTNTQAPTSESSGAEKISAETTEQIPGQLDLVVLLAQDPAASGMKEEA
ncbi:DDE-type integrase/transposase/recombinase [Kineosporia babensis]|uniref:DDE-type integrase/transposase/recombinase n=1 Tax=Kineosporia babensis TaxID=499548 RepID=A0A9X1NH21_9ACTN|nr:DDE-type integrase/transposase/recombinase [Kineosporia babensis]MCD5312978.1 DDE-type integrase/transposase/recombinase [Kineosporia babensis]